MNPAESVRPDPRRIFKKHPFFKSLARSGQKRLAEIAKWREFPKGTVLCTEGETCRHVYLLVSGRCKSVASNRRGKPTVTIVAPGGVIGRRCLAEGGRYDANVSVASDAVLLEFEVEAMAEIMGARRSASEIRRAVGSRIAGIAYPRWDAESAVHLESLARELAAVSGQAVLVVELAEHSPHEPSLADWNDIRGKLNGAFCFDDMIEDYGAWKRLRLRREGGEEAGDAITVAGLLGHLNTFFPYVLIGVGLEPRLAASTAFLLQTDVVFHHVEATEEELHKARLFRKEAGQLLIPEALKLQLIVRPEKGKPFPDLGWIAEKCRASTFSIIRGVDSGDSGFDAHLRHLARTIARRRVGLALSSGSAKGLAHIGAIRVLEELGIEVDAVAGTSMGAYVGACWCSGLDWHGLAELAGGIKTRGGVRKLIDPVFPPRTGFVRGMRVRRRLEEAVGGARFEDLSRDFYVSATNLSTLEGALFCSGDVASAVHASLAMPGVCTPVELDGVRYTDGAASVPLPVEVLEDLGIERIIAVNALPSVEDLIARAAEDPTDLKKRTWAREAVAFLNRHLNYFAAGNLLDTVLRGLQAGQIRLAVRAGRRADVYIHAYPKGSRWFHFDRHADYIRTGYEAASRHREALQQLATATK